MKYTKPNGKEDTLVIGDYPATSLKQARQARKAAEVLLAKSIDPKADKREQAIADLQARQNTFEALALEWHKGMAAT